MYSLKFLFVAALFVACRVFAQTPSVKVVKPVVPTTEPECIGRGGNWTTLGLPAPGKPKICDIKTNDSGKSCTDSSQCEGSCLAPGKAGPGTATAGSCSTYVANFGNVTQVKNGKVEQINVD